MIQNCDKNQFINLEGLYNNCFYVLLNKNLVDNSEYNEYLGDIKTQNQQVQVRDKTTMRKEGEELLTKIPKDNLGESPELDKVKKLDKILQKKYEKEKGEKEKKITRDKKIQEQKKVNKEQKENEEKEKNNRVIELNQMLNKLKSQENPNEEQMRKLKEKEKYKNKSNSELIQIWQKGKPERIKKIEDELNNLDPNHELRLLGGAKTIDEEETYLFIFKLDLDTENPNNNTHIFSDLCRLKNGPYEEVGIGDLCTYDDKEAVITNMRIIEDSKDGSLSYFFDIQYFDGSEEKNINPTITTGGWVFKTKYKFEVTGRNLVKKINGICINVTNFSKLNNKSLKTYLQLLDLNNNQNFYNTSSIRFIPNSNNCFLDLVNNGEGTQHICTIYENDYSDMINRNIDLMNQQNYLLNKYKNELELLLDYFMTSSAYNYLNCSTIFYYDVFKTKIRHWAAYYKTLWEMMLKQEKKKKHAETAATETLKNGVNFVKGMYNKNTINNDKKEGNQLLQEYKTALNKDTINSSDQTIEELKNIQDRIQQFDNIGNNKEINSFKTLLTDDETRGKQLVTDYNKALSTYNSNQEEANKTNLDAIKSDILQFSNLRKNTDIIRITRDIKPVSKEKSDGGSINNYRAKKGYKTKKHKRYKNKTKRHKRYKNKTKRHQKR